MTFLPQLERELLAAHPRASRRWLRRERVRSARVLVPALAALLVTAAVVAAALSLGGGRTPSAPSPAHPPPTGGGTPPLSSRQQRLLNLAIGDTIAHDRACAFTAPRTTVSDAPPPADILSRFAILRRTGPVALSPSRLVGPEGGRPYLGVVYQRHIRLARTVYVPPVGRIAGQTERYYLVPSNNVVGPPIPQRCYSEEHGALARLLRGATNTFRAATFAAQNQAFASETALAGHPEGIDVQIVSGRFVPDEFGGTLSQIERGFAFTNVGPAATHPLRDWIAGLVPDGVASVALTLPHGRLGQRDAPPTMIVVPVVHNIFVATVPNGRGFPTFLVWRNAAGRPSKIVPVP